MEDKILENENENMLDDTPVNLQDEIDAEEEEFTPPEEEREEVKELNVGNIFAAIFIGVAVLLCVVMIAGSGKSKKKIQNKELDKSGSKTAIEFKEKTNKEPEIIEDTQEPFDDKEEDKIKDDDVDKILDTLPKELQSGQAPVTPVGARSGGYSGKSDRPDTRNSKSPRKIEGIAGREYVSPDTNSTIISSVINGGYQAARPMMSKEQYIAQQMQETQTLQKVLYGSNAFGGNDGGNQNTASYQLNKENFFNQGNQGAGTGGGHYLSYNSLWDGTIISGELVTAINTDNPGVVIARVTENVYSSYDHSFLLIPEGSLLYATYNSSVNYGQNKVQVAWNLLIRPDGYRITLGNMNGVDTTGASGYSGHVSNHPRATLKALGMIAVYSIIQTEATNSINAQKNEYLQNAMSDVYTQSAKIGNKIIDRALDIKPTIKIKQGKEIKLITNVPLELPPCEVYQVTRKYIRIK
nr:TrbI/VirB10 family protein [Treponema socranskii]